MFALFVEWVNAPSSFRCFLDQATDVVRELGGPQAVQDIHWPIVRLHLFASCLDLDELQDRAMDGLQDLYLKCDWDVPPSLIFYLYTKCEPLPSVRIRLWTVAMAAFSLAMGPSQPSKPREQLLDTRALLSLCSLFSTLLEFAADYASHVRHLVAAGLGLRIKNPQLRIAANNLRNEQRLFGFQECSFHSHRAAFGEGRCPYAGDGDHGWHAAQSRTETDDMVPVAPSPTNASLDQDSIPRPLFYPRTTGGRSEGRTPSLDDGTEQNGLFLSLHIPGLPTLPNQDKNQSYHFRAGSIEVTNEYRVVTLPSSIGYQFVGEDVHPVLGFPAPTT